VRERRRFEREVSLSDAGAGGRPTSAPGIGLRAAARLNRRYALTLGWRKAFRQVAALLSLRGRTFPEAVARWQKSEGLVPDGVLGPRTWSRMRVRLRSAAAGAGGRGSALASPLAGGGPPAEREYREYFVPQAGAALSPGQFGLAFDPLLSAAGVPRDVIVAVAASPTFKSMARALDGKYVALSDVAARETVDNGVIVKGGRNGRRVLEAAGHPSFGTFVPMGDIDADVDQDRVVIHVAPGAPREHWVVQLALGAARAHGWITRKPRVAGAADNIRNAVRREARNLIEADRIIAQVFAAAFKGRTPPAPLAPGRLEDVERDVERGFHPSEWLRTGLEHWVLSEFAAAEMAARKLTLADTKRLKAEADRVVLADRRLDDYLWDPLVFFLDRPSGLFVPFASEYAEQRFLLRVLDARWKTLGNIATTPLGDVRRMREDHQQAFFRDVIRYRA
jgi:hypothetical protein